FDRNRNVAANGGLYARVVAPHWRRAMRAVLINPPSYVSEPARDGSRFSGMLTLAAMSLGYGVVQLDVTIVNTALDSIGSSLGGGVSELQWVVTAYTIAFAALILTAGALGDRFGAKKVFAMGFAIFTTASLAGASQPCLPRREGTRTRGRDLGGRREPRSHGGSTRRRRPDRACGLAEHL